MGKPRSYKIGNQTFEFNDSDPSKAQKSVDNLIQTISNSVELKNTYTESLLKTLKDYNKLTALCIEARTFQIAAMNASKDSNGPLFVENYNNARLKFKETQDHAKAMKAAGTNKIPNVPEELKSKGSEPSKIEQTYQTIVAAKTSAEELYKTTDTGSKQMTQHAAYLKDLGKQHGIGAKKVEVKDQKVHPAPEEAKQASIVNPGVVKAGLFPTQNNKAQAATDNSKGIAAGAAQSGKPNAPAK